MGFLWTRLKSILISENKKAQRQAKLATGFGFACPPLTEPTGRGNLPIPTRSKPVSAARGFYGRV